ncbi:hypothetical protein FQA39_LY07784 [Lamprigera yunnana]|nr:hypothetical protein FQA39_LY07784 [Lamprigera yunnana]
MSDTQSLQILDRPSYIGMIVALPFFLLSFAAYTILPLKRGHGKTFICFFASCFAAYMFYVVTHYIPHHESVSSSVCVTLTVILIYWILAMFCWLSAILHDGMMNIRDVIGYWDKISIQRRRRFWIYSAFSWSAPLFFVVLILTINQVGPKNSSYVPGLTDAKCWLNDGIPSFTYLYLPVTVTIIADVVILILMAMAVRQNKKGVSGSSRKKIVIKLRDYVLFFLIFLVLWLFDMVAWVTTWMNGSVPVAFWYAFEVVNACSGVAVFYLSVFRKTMRLLFQKRYREIRQNWRKQYDMGVYNPDDN